MQNFTNKDIAILGSTASGKTKLSLKLAQDFNAIILSLDSLSLYKEINIASAKPTKIERANIVHFGIDELNINEYFNSALFSNLYHKAKKYALNNHKNLIIVGGSSFYLKSLCEGLSPMPVPGKDIENQIFDILSDLQKAYNLIKEKDFMYAKNITNSDKYRIEKWYKIFLSTNLTATKYFEKNKREKKINQIKIFEIQTQRELLKKRIKIRTEKMISDGLIDEAYFLEKKYSRVPKAMKSIGLKESLEYLDGKITLEVLSDKISNATAGLAKRQKTFNKSQFKNVARGDKDKIYDFAKFYLQNN